LVQSLIKLAFDGRFIPQYSIRNFFSGQIGAKQLSALGFRPTDPTASGQYPEEAARIADYYLMRLTQPVLAGKAFNLAELVFIVGDEDEPECKGLSGDEQVVAGNSSSRGARVASTASSDFCGRGSRVRRSPSLRRMASEPGSSNSRGIRTAWFRPFLKSFTCRSRLIAALQLLIVLLARRRDIAPSREPTAADTIRLTFIMEFVMNEIRD
jgi:hypothetical protein